jgi:hypothetical protein
MYHAAETFNIELTLDLRNLGVPWTMYSWIQTLRSANDSHVSSVVNELLQDFCKTWLDEKTSSFVDIGLELLFSIFKTSWKNEGTMLLLAEIFSVCYAEAAATSSETDCLLSGTVVSEQEHKVELHVPSSSSYFSSKGGSVTHYNHPSASKTSSRAAEKCASNFSSILAPSAAAMPRIDPKFVNSPELSDVQFRVEGKIFYAHKLVLVTASSRFHSMLNSRFADGSPPILQINDIRYEIFQLVMNYLYDGCTKSLRVDSRDILELMAAANFFQLPGLLQYCETASSKLVDLDNVVSYYIHAKVYSAAQLLEFCECFLLKNMVALLTYDDSVKRLILGKKLQSNHDVLAGLLQTLQRKLRLRTNGK